MRRMIVVWMTLVSFAPAVMSQDWCCRFHQERKLALRREGPIVLKEEGHAHAPKKSALLVMEEPKAAPVRVKRPSRRRAVKAARLPRPNANEILLKAGRARENGQLEQALRLYKLAQKMEGSPEVAAKIGEIEREMN